MTTPASAATTNIEETMMTTTEDLQTRIDTDHDGRYVYVDSFDEGRVWLSVYVSGGNVNCVLTKDQAREMIAALNRVVEAE